MSFNALNSGLIGSAKSVLYTLFSTIKDNFDNHQTRINTLEAAVITIPTGTTLPYAGTSAPSGYLLCDGSAISRATYSDLFAVISTTYGVGDGSTTFNIPDFRGKSPLGAGEDTTNSLTNRTLGAFLGEEDHTLTSSEMPSHTHTVTHSHDFRYNGPNSSAATRFDGLTTSAGNDNELAGPNAVKEASPTSSSAGSDSAHNNMQPSLVVNFIIKT